MDYCVAFPYSRAETLGFQLEGCLEITANTLNVTGSRPDPKNDLGLMSLLLVLLTLMLLLYLTPDRWHAILGNIGYWIVLSSPFVFILLMRILYWPKTHTQVFPLAQLRQVICQDTNFTLLLENDCGETSILGLHPSTTLLSTAISTAQEINTALEMHRPYATPITFGYQGKPNMLVPKGQATLTLTEQHLDFSSLTLWRSTANPEDWHWWAALLPVMICLRLLQDILRSATIATEVIVVAVLCLVLFGLYRYGKRHRRPYTFFYRQIQEIVPQGNAVLLRFQESSAKIRSIFFRLPDPAQMTALLAELQERMAASTT